MAGWQAIHTTDLSIHVHASPSPAKAGGQLLYAFSVRNQTNPADRTVAVITLPPTVSYTFGDDRCQAKDATVTCELGPLPATTVNPFALLVTVPAGAAGQLLGCQATVRHYYTLFDKSGEGEGPDPNLQNNTVRSMVPVQ